MTIVAQNGRPALAWFAGWAPVHGSVRALLDRLGPGFRQLLLAAAQTCVFACPPSSGGHARLVEQSLSQARSQGLLTPKGVWPKRGSLQSTGQTAKSCMWANGPGCNSQGHRPWNEWRIIIAEAPSGRPAVHSQQTCLMPQSLALLLVHLVFSTKNREPWIRGAIEPELFAYGTTVLTSAGCPTLAMNGTADHVHALLNLSRTMSIAQIVEELKTSTSKWIKTKEADFRGFHWQAGYGAFSVSPSNIEDVIQYIRRQHEHHRRQSFQNEFRALLERHKIPFDERYVWD